MKKLNRKGFTLIELLAVIVIMGVLMMVAIPAMQTYINNSKKDTYVNTLKEVVNVVRNADAAGYLENSGTVCNSGKYYVTFDTSTGGLLESGGKSPFNKGAIKGYVLVDTTVSPRTYSVAAVDGSYGFTTAKNVDALVRGDVAPTTATSVTAPTSATACTISN